MAEPALVVRDLCVTLGRREVLRGVACEARYGEVLAVLGPNGAGKSTLLRATSGLVPYRGEVVLDGRNMAGLPPRERAKHMSFVPQQSMLTAAMPVEQVVAQGRYAHRPAIARPTHEDDTVVAEAMRETDVQHLARRAFNELSHGEQKRVLLARALATGARILLLDEPSAALDIEHALRLFVLLRKLAAQGRAIVVVLHQLDDALTYCDCAVLLRQGSVVAQGPSREVVTPERVRELYGVVLIEGGGFGFRLPEVAT